MEACLRGIPCVSSDVFGLPEANCNPNLVVHATLSFDHARGTLLHGVSNAQLEDRLGANPKLPSREERSSNIIASTRQSATDEEARPFEEQLRRLLMDEASLRAESAICRERFVAFARRREHGLRRELERIAAVRSPPTRADAWCEALEDVRERGYRVRALSGADVVQRHSDCGDEPAADDTDDRSGDLKVESSSADGDAWLDELRPAVSYRVVHAPLVFVRRAPATDAEVLATLPTGTAFEADAMRNGWVRIARDIVPLTGGAARRGWALVDGAKIGLGTLLERVPKIEHAPCR